MTATTSTDREEGEMADQPADQGTRAAGGQHLVGFRTNEEWDDLVAETGAMLAALDEIEDEAATLKVQAALAGIDTIHREALHRLVRLFKEGVLEQVATDPAIRTLLGMYDLLPPEEPGCQKVWDFLPREPAPIAAGEPPHWSPAPIEAAPLPGEAFFCAMEEGAVVLARAEGELYAFSAHCPRHGGVMAGGRLERLAWLCPLGPGCAFDVRNGARLGGGAGLTCLPVREDEKGRVLIGFNMPFEPKMPAF